MMSHDLGNDPGNLAKTRASYDRVAEEYAARIAGSWRASRWIARYWGALSSRLASWALSRISAVALGMSPPICMDWARRSLVLTFRQRWWQLPGNARRRYPSSRDRCSRWRRLMRRGAASWRCTRSSICHRRRGHKRSRNSTECCVPAVCFCWRFIWATNSTIWMSGGGRKSRWIRGSSSRARLNRCCETPDSRSRCRWCASRMRRMSSIRASGRISSRANRRSNLRVPHRCSRGYAALGVTCSLETTVIMAGNDPELR